MSVFDRFNAEGRQVFTLAGELAAERARAQRRLPKGHIPKNVQINCDDMRRATRLMRGSGWHGNSTDALNRRLGTIIAPSIGLAELEKAFKR